MKNEIEIVAFIIDGKTITTDFVAVATALRRNKTVGYVSKLHARFMGICDLGPQWNLLAEAPVLFKMVENELIVTEVAKAQVADILG